MPKRTQNRSAPDTVWRRLGVGWILVWFVGCGSNLAEVQGTVLIVGQMVVGASNVRGTVVFAPREAGLPTGSGVLNEAGQYSIYVRSNEGLKPGPYAVAVTVTKARPANTEGARRPGSCCRRPSIPIHVNQGCN